MGATPYIAMRSNTSAVRGGPFQDIFHYYSLRREEFLRHHHRRSNVESTFSILKAKFGADRRSKSETSMVDESLAKVLCHKVFCVIQSHYELGIAVMFWREQSMGSGADAMQIDAFAWL
jgi:transposase